MPATEYIMDRDFTLDVVFDDGILQKVEAGVEQKVSASVEDMDNEPYTFYLFDHAEGGEAVATKSGVVPENADRIYATFTAEELQELTNPVCSIDLWVSGDLAKVQFKNELSTAEPEMEEDPVVDVPAVSERGGITSHTDGDVTKGSVVNFKWGADDSYGAYWVMGYDAQGEVFFNSKQLKGDILDIDATEIPSGAYSIELTAIRHDGEGGLKWDEKTQTTYKYNSLPSPKIAILDNGDIITDPYNLSWDAAGAEVDGWRIKVGSKEGGNEFGSIDVSGAQSSTVDIKGYGGQNSVFIQLYSVVGVTETLLDQKSVKANSDFVLHGYNNNIGHMGDDSQFKAPKDAVPGAWSKGRLKIHGKSNFEITDFKIEVTDIDVVSHYDGGISMTDCHNVKIKRGYITFPDKFLYTRKPNKQGKNKVVIYGGIIAYKCSGIEVDRVQVRNAHSSFRFDTCEDIKLTNWMSVNCHQHHVIMRAVNEKNGHRFTVDTGYGYRTGPRNVSSSMDGMNYAQNFKSGKIRATVKNVFLEYGLGTNGSGFISEGPGSKKEVGFIDFSNITLYNTNNKGFSCAGGNGNTYTDILALQTRFETPKGKSCGPWSVYEHDFFNEDGNKKDINFGQCIYKRCRTHWKKDGRGVVGFSEVYEKDDKNPRIVFGKSKRGFHWTPKGNAPTYIDCQFDADKDENPEASGNPAKMKNKKNWVKPCVDLREIREVSMERLVGIPNYPGFGGKNELDYYNEVFA